MMSVSCGVMAWILYTPEDGEGVQSVEAWLPFAMKWELPETQYDGRILTSCFLNGVDARSTSARKLMVRANLEMKGEAWLQTEEQVAVADGLPEDVEVLTSSYPVLLPKEAGEKAFQLEEQLSMPNGGPKPGKLMYYSLQPEIVDKKVMAGKVVFRGVGMLHMLYRGEDGGLYPWDCELPFSQYGDLEGEFEDEPTVSMRPCVTSLDVSLDENGELQVKAGILAQYLLLENTMIVVPEDAYSPSREMTVTREELHLPAVLDQTVQIVRGEKSVQADVQQIVDVTFNPQFGEQERSVAGIAVSLPGQFQMLYYDTEGMLHGVTEPWEGAWSLPVAENTEVSMQVFPTGKPQAVPGAGNISLRAEVNVDAMTAAGQGIPMITGMEMGEKEKSDSSRPALILCRLGNRRLWDVAKACGSTVDAIRKANHLEAEPESSAVLLIPVK